MTPVFKCLKNCHVEPVDTFFVASGSGTKTNGESSRRQISQHREEKVRPLEKEVSGQRGEQTKARGGPARVQRKVFSGQEISVHLVCFPTSGGGTWKWSELTSGKGHYSQ